MYRLASFFALACLTLAASALLSAPKATAQQPPPDNENNEGLRNRVPALPNTRCASFHARFSLN
jgi:hypothetical protein